MGEIETSTASDINRDRYCVWIVRELQLATSAKFPHGQKAGEDAAGNSAKARTPIGPN